MNMTVHLERAASITTLALILLFLCRCTEGDSQHTDEIREPEAPREASFEDTLLPQQEDLRGWGPCDAARLYAGDDLFIYINGGAEIYHEYGFVSVIAKEYADGDGRKINLEIFEMDDARSAYGIYSFKRSSDGERLQIGSEAALEDYYLNFWKGHHLVTLIGFDESEQTVNGLRQIAQAVAARIPKIDAGAQPPADLLSHVAGEDFMHGSIRYIEGALALYNSYPFFTENVFAFNEALCAERLSGERVFLFDFGTCKRCLEEMPPIEEKFRNTSKYENFTDRTNGFSINDRDNRMILVAPHANFIAVVIGAAGGDLRGVYAALEGITASIDRSE